MIEEGETKEKRLKDKNSIINLLSWGNERKREREREREGKKRKIELINENADKSAEIMLFLDEIVSLLLYIPLLLQYPIRFLISKFLRHETIKNNPWIYVNIFSDFMITLNLPQG